MLVFALHPPFPDLNNTGLCCNPSALNSPDLKLVALSTFHLLTCHAEIYFWTLIFLLSIIFETNLKSKVLCIFHMNDAVSRMLKAWECCFQQSKSTSCVTVMIIYLWLH